MRFERHGFIFAGLGRRAAFGLLRRAAFGRLRCAGKYVFRLRALLAAHFAQALHLFLVYGLVCAPRLIGLGVQLPKFVILVRVLPRRAAFQIKVDHNDDNDEEHCGDDYRRAVLGHKGYFRGRGLVADLQGSRHEVGVSDVGPDLDSEPGFRPGALVVFQPAAGDFRHPII
ncbi:MAG: hypothetical protein EBU46_17650 [Nitrosomonadaceae bacterium]|nr:hypothetical protein [Nitrosomonadaceae bacterium]